MSEQLEERLDRFERTLSALQAELADLRRIAAGPKAPAPSPPRPPAPVSAPRWQLLDPAPAPRAAAPAAPPLSARIAEALGARALALTGGAVTLLGVVLLFALAVNRGWIGPWERCGIGFAASAAVFLGGLWLRRRYGTTYSALSAVGAGIGGAYASLLAAAALYHLLSPPAALVLAGAIAAVGVGTSIAWSAEIVAGFGLIGAMLVPPAVVFDGGLTVLGTSFVAIVLAAAGIVALWRRWRGLRVAAVGASLPQIAVLVGTANPGSARVAVLAAIFWLLYLAGAIAEKLRGKARLQGLPATLALLAAALAGGSAVALFGGAGEGFALLAIGGVYGAAGGAFLNRERDLSSLLWAVGLAVGAVGLADLVSGDVLAIGWAAEAAVLAWLAVRTREVRFQLGAFAYLALATGHALTVDAPLAHLFVVRTHPAAGAVSVVAAALAAATAAFYARGRSGEDGAAGGNSPAPRAVLRGASERAAGAARGPPVGRGRACDLCRLPRDPRAGRGRGRIFGGRLRLGPPSGEHVLGAARGRVAGLRRAPRVGAPRLRRRGPARGDLDQGLRVRSRLRERARRPLRRARGRRDRPRRRLPVRARARHDGRLRRVRARERGAARDRRRLPGGW